MASSYKYPSSIPFIIDVMAGYVVPHTSHIRETSDDTSHSGSRWWYWLALAALWAIAMVLLKAGAAVVLWF